jgi:hypothetical protein
MYDFLEYIKQYIADCFANDTDIASTYIINSYDVDLVGHTPTKTEVQVGIMDNAEVERYSTFGLGERISYIPLQINLIGFQMKLENVMTAPRVVSLKLGQKIKTMLNNLQVGGTNKNILRVRIMGMSPALKYEGGEKAYYTAIRCEFYVANPYNTELEN